MPLLPSEVGHWVLHWVLYSAWSCVSTQRSWTITDFILHLHLHCRSIKFAPVSVWFPVSQLSLHLFCLPSLMLRSLHLIEVESIIAEKMISSDLKCIQACSRASKMFGVIKRTISYKTLEIIVRLYKTLLRPHLEYCVSVWSPQYTKVRKCWNMYNIDLLGL